MVTALYTHPDMLNHRAGRQPQGAARAAAGGARGAEGGQRPRSGARAAPFVTRAELDSVHAASLRRSAIRSRADRGPASTGRGHRHVAGQPHRRAPRRRRGGRRRAFGRPRRDDPRLLRRAARPATTPSRRGRWGFACSPTSPSARRAAQAEGLAASRSSISTSTTATAPRPWSRTIRSLFFASIHQSPGSIRAPATRRRRGWATWSTPRSRPMRARERLAAAFEALMPRARRLRARSVLISAGFDAHARDPWPNRRWRLRTTPGRPARSRRWRATRARGRIVSSLEGGYDLEALGQRPLAHVRALEEG